MIRIVIAKKEMMYAKWKRVAAFSDSDDLHYYLRKLVEDGYIYKIETSKTWKGISDKAKTKNKNKTKRKTKFEMISKD